MPDTHIWENIHAVRTNKKGRARGGILVGIKKNWGSMGEKIVNALIKEGIVHTRIVNVGKGLNIFTIYNAENKGKIEESRKYQKNAKNMKGRISSWEGTSISEQVA